MTTLMRMMTSSRSSTRGRIAQANEDDVKAKHAAALDKWKAAVAKAKEEGKQPPQRPRDPQAPKAKPHYPCVLFNAMVAPLTPYAIEGGRSGIRANRTQGGPTSTAN